jgi:hypothetical protein
MTNRKGWAAAATSRAAGRHEGSDSGVNCFAYSTCAIYYHFFVLCFHAKLTCAMLVYTVAFPFRQDQVCDNCTGPPSHPSIDEADEAYEASMRSNTTWVASCQEDGNPFFFHSCSMMLYDTLYENNMMACARVAIHHCFLLSYSPSPFPLCPHDLALTI